ncbi:tetratricopeptide repeat protein [Sphingomonas sp. XXL09]|uniref:tetratricopeptide repeat protein n=1 Tax=Sphingomonas sp. XXL09 TaxID=3457787 RepID=UPI00406BC782
MIALLFAAAVQSATPAPPAARAAALPEDSREARYQRCVVTAESDPAAARAEALRWAAAGGSWFARQCAGLAYTQERNWTAAAGEFEAAAKAAELGHNVRAANYWAQAGNAWLAAGDPGKARAALDTALVAGTLTGLALGEAQLDHARAMVAAGQNDAARRDLDLALTTAGDDPLAWLLSATLARREGDVPRARKDIAEALRRSPDDASVQLEAGNIAALARDETGARAAWAQAARLAPTSPVGKSALAALQQFDTPATTPPPASVPPAQSR